MDGLILADIPGLIEGASQGKGLGDRFLRHIEKTQVLLHCLDVQSDNLEADYRTIRKELQEYKIDLSGKTEILLLTKTDCVDREVVKRKLSVAKELNSNALAVSIYDDESLNLLKAKILTFFQK
jgi:GTP-binding protein